MNIWFVHNYAGSPFTAGVTKHFMLANELQKLGHNPVIIAADLNHKNKETKLDAGQKYLYTKYDAIPFLWLKTFSNSDGQIKRVLNMFSFFWRVIRKTGFDKLPKPDVIIGCSPEPFAALAALFVAKKYKVPFILHMGDLWPLSLIDIGDISKYHPFIILVGMVEKYLYKHADRIVTPLPTIDNHVKNNGGNPDRIIWLQNGIDTDKLPKYKKSTSSKTFKIYYAGAHGPANSLDSILDAAKIIQDINKDIEFVLIGNGPEKARLQKRATDENIPNVIFLNPVKKDEIYPELQKADAFISVLKDLPVFREGGISPNKLYDYMGIGRPTIVACSAPSNPVMSANAGLTTGGADAQGIAKSAITLQKMPHKERLKLGRNGYDFVIENNTYSKIGKDLEGILKSVIKGKS